MSFVTLAKQHESSLQHIANAIRGLSMDAVLQAKSGHIGLPLGGADMMALLYFVVLKHDPANSRWINRDRFVLSAGHGSMLQYAALHLAGYDVTLNDIKKFRQLGSRTPGHPEFGHTDGIECTTGPLGQGLANAVGLALAEEMLKARLGNQHIQHKTYVIAGDGCLMEGVTSEASSLAGHLQLSQLVVLYDCNNITIDGKIDISFSEDVGKRYEAYGWEVVYADGHCFVSLAAALDKPTQRPKLIVCKTIPGKGSPKWEGNPKVHGNPMTAEDVLAAKTHLKIESTEPFVVSAQATKAVANILGTRQGEAYKTWTQILQSKKASDSTFAQTWDRYFNAPNDFTANPIGGAQATRVASGKALIDLAARDPRLVGGSADLAGSNNTTIPNSSFVSAGSFEGRNIHFGVREHAMGAICNGIALHGGLLPYCATFAVFSDYMRPAIRMAAIMACPSIFILTHDSYAVGEDGPTHQPVEHAAALRSIPGLNVYRPADALETSVAWSVAHDKGPTALLLTRQDVPDLDQELLSLHLPARTRGDVEKGFACGGYLVKEATSHKMQQLTFVASGSEVALCLAASVLLESSKFKNTLGHGVDVGVRVVSAPAPQQLARNPIELSKLVPGFAIAVEAGSPMGWSEVVCKHGGVVFGMNGFGASGKAADVAKMLGFTPDQLVTFALNQLGLVAANSKNTL